MKIKIEKMNLQNVKIAHLKPLQGNLKFLPDDNYEKLKKSFQEKGLFVPMFVWHRGEKDFAIMDGHGREKFFKKECAEFVDENGKPTDEVPCVVIHADNLKDAKEKLLIITSQYQTITQEGLDGFGVDLDEGWVDDTVVFDALSGLDDDETGYEPTEQDDVVPENPPTICKTGDLWILGEHRLLCGDATKREDVERLMDGEKADMVFTSPPYAVGVDYGKYDDTIENLREMLPKLSKLFLELVVDGGFAVINFGDIASARVITKTIEPCEYPMALEYYPVFFGDGWLLWSRRVWCKPNPRVHSLQCISSNRAATDFEHIWTWKKKGEAIIKRVDGLSCYGWIDTTKEIGVEIGKNIHGAGMAVSIAVKMIEIHARKKKIVFEPFAGTGTTLIACEKLNRKCRMLEIDEKYCDVIISRWEDFTGNKATISK